jgi:GT2 family glycosyltransferase
MALIAMAVYDTKENGRTEFTRRTIKSLLNTVDFSNHRLIIVDNNSCAETCSFYNDYVYRQNLILQEHGKNRIEVIHLDKNYGTAAAINQAMFEREKDEYFIKMDNDVEFNKVDWVEEMEDAMRRMPKLGVLGLKRKDVCESTYSLNPDQRSRLIEVPHFIGEKWYVIEECKHVMGTCTMLSHALIEKIGYFYQMDGIYGFDDSLMCIRCSKAGFINAFLHGIEIDHIDPGGGDYQKWKEEYAQKMIHQYAECQRMYENGTMSIYYNPFEKC